VCVWVGGSINQAGDQGQIGGVVPGVPGVVITAARGRVQQGRHPQHEPQDPVQLQQGRPRAPALPPPLPALPPRPGGGVPRLPPLLAQGGVCTHRGRRVPFGFASCGAPQGGDRDAEPPAFALVAREGQAGVRKVRGVVTGAEGGESMMMMMMTMVARVGSVCVCWLAWGGGAAACRAPQPFCAAFLMACLHECII
jgi:hypothetical protein